jgi:hypothetical protein
LLRELGEKDVGGRKIYIFLNPQLGENQMALVANRYPGGWVYGMELPTDMASQRLSAAVLQVLLVELANRSATNEQVDVPRWLLAGLVSEMQASQLQSLTLQPDVQTDVRRSHEQRNLDPLDRLRERFQTEAPLSFEEMSWPETLETNKANVFQDSAQLFVHELLRMNNGRLAMRQFIRELPAHRNWQFAFLKTMGFSQLVDIEKWWALKTTTLMGRETAKLWSVEESWDRLKAALDVSVQIHLKNDRLPVAGKLSLQEIIEQWDATRQELTLRKAIIQLRMIRYRVQPEFLSLTDDYRKTLENYLQQRVGGKAKPGQQVNTIVLKKSVRRQLDNLDDRRMKLRAELLASRPAATGKP